MRLDDKTAVITGGSSGIGLAIADAFQQEGANVVVSGRGVDGLRAAERRLGPRVLGVQGDVTNTADLEGLFATAGGRFGTVDVLVVNAGGIAFTPVGATTEEDFDTASDLNFKAVFFTVQAALPHLADGASVMAIGNALSATAVVGPSVAIAAKAAVRSLARTFAVELAPRGIRVNVLSPGPTTAAPEEIPQPMSAQITRQIPLGRWGHPDDVARAAVFLASDESTYITGADIHVGGGIGMGWVPPAES